MVATLAGIQNQIRKINQARPQRIITVFGDDPIPPHRPGDIVMEFRNGEERFL